MATTKTVIGNVVTAVTNNIAKIKTAIGNATTSAAGLMSNTDKTKLDGVDTGANKTTIVNNLTATTAGSALDATQGKALSDSISSLNSSLANRVDSVGGITTSFLASGNFSGVFNQIIISGASMGSCSISPAYGVLPVGWYNFIYIPHGNGHGSDLPNYGTLLLFPMTLNTLDVYIVHRIAQNNYINKCTLPAS